MFALPGIGINLSIFWKLTVPIIMISSAVIADIVRAGIRALDRGQTEAAPAGDPVAGDPARRPAEGLHPGLFG